MRVTVTHLRRQRLTRRTGPKPWMLCTITSGSCVLGETKTPLAYIIRDAAEVPSEADDLATNYDTPKNEMIARMPHQDGAGLPLPTYIHDRSKVWQTMAEICRDDKYWIYVKPFQ
jgi:hypothetical protein